MSINLLQFTEGFLQTILAMPELALSEKCLLQVENERFERQLIDAFALLEDGMAENSFESVQLGLRNLGLATYGIPDLVMLDKECEIQPEIDERDLVVKSRHLSTLFTMPLSLYVDTSIEAIAIDNTNIYADLASSIGNFYDQKNLD